MSNPTDSLIDKLLALKPDFGDMGPSPEDVAYMDAIDHAIGIIRQHEAAMGDASTRKDEDHSAVIATVPNSTSPTNTSEIRDNKLPLDVDVAEIVCSKIEQGRYGANPSQYLIANVAAQYAIAFMSEREPVSVSLEKCCEATFNEYYPKGYGAVRNYQEAEESHKANLRRGAKAILDAAGVKYVD